MEAKKLKKVIFKYKKENLKVTMFLTKTEKNTPRATANIQGL